MNQPIEPELRTGFDTAKVFVCLCVCVRPNFPSLSRTQSGRLWPLSTTKATRAESACMCMSLCIRMSPVYCMSFYMSVCVVGDAATHTQLVCISRRRQDAHHVAQNQSNTSKTTPPSYWQMAIKLKICGHCNNTRTLSRIYKLQTRSNMAVKHNTTGTWETDAHTHTQTRLLLWLMSGLMSHTGDSCCFLIRETPIWIITKKLCVTPKQYHFVERPLQIKIDAHDYRKSVL